MGSAHECVTCERTVCVNLNVQSVCYDDLHIDCTSCTVLWCYMRYIELYEHMSLCMNRLQHDTQTLCLTGHMCSMHLHEVRCSHRSIPLCLHGMALAAHTTRLR